METKTAPLTVAVLGASSNPARYSFKAISLLQEKGYKVLPVSLKDQTILNVSCVPTLANIKMPVDTLTMYVGPERSGPLLNDILTLAPRRVIFNPGSENEELMQALSESGIEVEEACTLVLLRTNQF